MSSLERFHPAVSGWFRDTFGTPTAPQEAGWPKIHAREHTLIAAPTGSGKTFAAFLCAIDDLVCRGLAGELRNELDVVYVSPLKALSNDIQKNLEQPVAGIERALAAMGLPKVAIRTGIRTGDTPQSDRAKLTKTPPHILVTTPESLFILLTSDSGRQMLQTARTVIIDEIHAMVRDKRGSHLALSIARLEHLCKEARGQDTSLVRIGLSATQRPIEEVARFLVGSAAVAPDGVPACHVIDGGHVRRTDVAIEVPSSPLETVMSNEVWEEIYDRLTTMINEHRTTLVFVNTRRLAERVTRHLSERLGEEQVTSHHGSLSREHRLDAEQRLKRGELKALVATASLELGIDIGDVDLVCQLGATRTISAFLQRVGRSGHFRGGVPKGRLFPLNRDELVEAAALLDSMRRGELDELSVPDAPLDVLAQQIIAMAACEEWRAEDLLAVLRTAWPYRDVSQDAFDSVIRMLADGFSTRRGRRSAYIHHDRVNGRIRGRRGARLAAITSGGTIPDVADYDVILEPAGVRVGSLNEDFAIESMAGDIFQLGNVSYAILRVEPGKVRVEDARGQPPSIPFWFGEAPARSNELSASLSRLRSRVEILLNDQGRTAAARYLADEVGLGASVVDQIVDYLDAVRVTLGAIPTQQKLVVERFFDEAENMHVVLHVPYGNRINRAWGLALRKSFCRSFNFELQAAATEDAIILSLGPTHSFLVEDTWSFLRSKTVRNTLTQALLDSPLFGTRFRWAATRALSILRFSGGKKVPPQLQRMRAEDLLSVVFPDQVACAENIVGDREIPDHPLVHETLRDCLLDAMDVDGLVDVLERIEREDIALISRDLTEPSPLSSSILNARPYSFLDDAPLEERRTQAVMSRRWLDPQTASDLGALDPQAIATVCSEAWPDARDADELHDALVLLGFMTDKEAERSEWQPLLHVLGSARRATCVTVSGTTARLWVTAERLEQVLAVHPSSELSLSIAALASSEPPSREAAILELLRGRLEGVGPTTARELAHSLCIVEGDVDAALATLESQGFVLRGTFRPGATEPEWCERRLLARIHRYTLKRLRREIEPVTASEFIRFLVGWQRASTRTHADGPEGLLAVIELLEGFEAPASAWETELLPSRMRHYDPAWLDQLCLSGHVTWARRTPPGTLMQTHGSAPVRSTPTTLMPRSAMSTWLSVTEPTRPEHALSPAATTVLEHLERRGASFFDEIVAATALLRAQTDDAIGELVYRGLITSDSFGGLRALLTSPHKHRPRFLSMSLRRPSSRMDGAGRWCVVTRNPLGNAELEHLARSLLRRWGVVFRKVVDREGTLPPWRDLLRVYRRLEARGEIRGGRFVAGFAGEQYALPEAIGSLRESRRKPVQDEWTSLSAADPLNILGILLPGPRLPSITKNRLLLKDGACVALREARSVSFVQDVDGPQRLIAESALTKRAAVLPMTNEARA